MFESVVGVVEGINLNLRWQQIIIYAFLICLVLNIAMFVALFGWTAMFILAIISLIIVCLFEYAYIVRFTKIIVAMEDAITGSMDEINDSIDEFNNLIKELPYIEDYAATVKMRNSIISIKMNLIEIPTLIDRAIKNQSSDAMIEDDEQEEDSDVGIVFASPPREETEEEFLENLRRRMESLENEQ
jgi:hypothetical protein